MSIDVPKVSTNEQPAKSMHSVEFVMPSKQGDPIMKYVYVEIRDITGALAEYVRIAQKEFPDKRLEELRFWPTTHDEYVLEGAVDQVEPGGRVVDSGVDQFK